LCGRFLPPRLSRSAPLQSVSEFRSELLAGIAGCSERALVIPYRLSKPVLLLAVHASEREERISHVWILRGTHLKHVHGRVAVSRLRSKVSE
jgi:hypothetical protein